MRIIVASDSHRDFYALHLLVERYHKTAGMFIHLGDGAGDVEQVRGLYPNCRILNVRGNCDFGVSAALAGCFSCEGARIFYTHGHMHNVKYGLDDIIRAGKEVQANVILFGHTHIPMEEYQDGIHLLNPGSLGRPRAGVPTYGVVDIEGENIVCSVREMKFN